MVIYPKNYLNQIFLLEPPFYRPLVYPWFIPGVGVWGEAPEGPTYPLKFPKNKKDSKEIVYEI